MAVVFGCLVTVAFDIFGVFFALLLGLMVLDFITGIMASSCEGVEPSSSIGKKGLTKKFSLILALFAVYMIEFAVRGVDLSQLLAVLGVFGVDVGADIAAMLTGTVSPGLIGSSFAFMFSLLEFISILENVERAGYEWPTKVKAAITEAGRRLGKSKEGNE